MAFAQAGPAHAQARIQAVEPGAESRDTVVTPSQPADVAQPDAPIEPEAGLRERNNLLGDPFGWRSAGEAAGLHFDAAAISDYSVALDGGDAPRETAANVLLQAGITLDTAAMFGLPGGTLRAAYLGFHGDTFDIGDVQGFNNIDDQSFDALYSLWYRQTLFDDRFAVKLGKMDANDDFAYVDNGIEFLNESPGYSPTLLSFPSYPDSATGIALFADLPSGLYGRAGVYDGSSLNGRRTGTRGPDNFLNDDSDLFSIGEAGLIYTLAGRDGRFGAGYWQHDGDFERFDGRSEDDSDGVYLVWDQALYVDPASDFFVDAFAQYGAADEAVSAVSDHIGAGVTAGGLIADRPADLTGLMVSRVELSDAAGAGFVADHETVIEVFHAIRLAGWLSLKPDVQYIVNPGGMGQEDAKVATLRGEIAF